MQAGRATTVNYYGLLRDDASDGTAETESPDALIHHLPSEVLAVVPLRDGRAQCWTCGGQHE